MRSVLATPRGSELYKQRAQLIEPIFGNTKHNRGFIRFETRQIRRQDRMAADGHHPQPLKLHQHFTADDYLRGGAAAAAPIDRAALSATASPAGSSGVAARARPHCRA